MEGRSNFMLVFEGQCYGKLLSKAVEGSEAGERLEPISLFEIKTMLPFHYKVTYRNIFENSHLRLKEI